MRWSSTCCNACAKLGGRSCTELAGQLLVPGRGGDDAPPLDDMRGHLSATEIALMSGAIWNHTPAMLEHFEEEGIPFPTFSGTEMADLIAYLHGGPP